VALRGSGNACALAALAATGMGCNSHILVGADPSGGSCVEDAGSNGALTLLLLPWQTGFENGFNDWGQAPNQGFCYPIVPVGGASYAIVTSPVHSGQHAAAFTVNTGADSPSLARCKRQGVLPSSAYYGAWYFVPFAATNRDNWNLLHFQGSNVANGNCVIELWDVSLVNDASGALVTAVYDFRRARRLAAVPAIPIGRWFHLVVFFRRAADNTGEFTLYQDGQVVVPLTGLATDDSAWGEWHVGNLATALSPGLSTVYVDDVSISASGP
jgi:hypothetical protein